MANTLAPVLPMPPQPGPDTLTARFLLDLGFTPADVPVLFRPLGDDAPAITPGICAAMAVLQAPSP